MNKQPPLKKKCKCHCHFHSSLGHCTCIDSIMSCVHCSPAKPDTRRHLAKKEECWACEDAPEGYKHHHCKDLDCPRNHHEPVGKEVVRAEVVKSALRWEEKWKTLVLDVFLKNPHKKRYPLGQLEVRGISFIQSELARQKKELVEKIKRKFPLSKGAKDQSFWISDLRKFLEEIEKE